ncbi:hypothetical protein J2Y03_005774 [Neobacillus niacini]|uniref:hypothetical protein n=1 Tax=Neobacillus niacini TaxID=86668 RepID=UPI00285A34DA|nr:hypothetical protein [Neobacillus niacini]MDR7080683.1 hypothetical protein [Neobacillus niacini]
MYKWIIGVLIILLVGGSIYMITNKNDYKEAPYAAGMNFDLEEVEPFLKHLSSSVLDSGFSQDYIDTIQSEINTMKEDNEVKEIGTFDVIYKGKPTKIRIEAEIHIEDVSKEVVLYMYSLQELVDIIDEEMLKTEEEEE